MKPGWRSAVGNSVGICRRAFPEAPRLTPFLHNYLYSFAYKLSANYSNVILKSVIERESRPENHYPFAALGMGIFLIHRRGCFLFPKPQGFVKSPMSLTRNHECKDEVYNNHTIEKRTRNKKITQSRNGYFLKGDA